jgi:hypothetical protein
MDELYDLFMSINFYNMNGLTALLFGVLILIFPKLLNYLIALYLIIIGLSSVFGLP